MENQILEYAICLGRRSYPDSLTQHDIENYPLHTEQDLMAPETSSKWKLSNRFQKKAS